MNEYNAFQLANMADVACPDATDSPGTTFLLGVQDDVNEAIEYDRDRIDADRYEVASEIADTAVPIYTYERWRVFTDLAAWQEDDELGWGESGDLTEICGQVLYQIASRLASVLIDEAEESADDEDDDQ